MLLAKPLSRVCAQMQALTLAHFDDEDVIPTLVVMGRGLRGDLVCRHGQGQDSIYALIRVCAQGEMGGSEHADIAWKYGPLSAVGSVAIKPRVGREEGDMWRKIHQHSLDSILPSKRSLVCVCVCVHSPAQLESPLHPTRS